MLNSCDAFIKCACRKRGSLNPAKEYMTIDVNSCIDAE